MYLRCVLNLAAIKERRITTQTASLPRTPANTPAKHTRAIQAKRLRRCINPDIRNISNMSRLVEQSAISGLVDVLQRRETRVALHNVVANIEGELARRCTGTSGP